MVKFALMFKSPWFWFILALLGALILAALAPVEKTLGVNARIVYLHGAWVWTALVSFLLAALSGLVGVLVRQRSWQRWSRGLGRTGLFFWLTFLPMSLYVMQANWNGLFLDEPRFRIPLNFAIVGLLLQIGLTFFPLLWTCLANLVFGVVLFAAMNGVQTVMHPESPIFNAGAGEIRLFYIGLLLLLIIAAWQQTCLWVQWDRGKNIQA